MKTVLVVNPRLPTSGQEPGEEVFIPTPDSWLLTPSIHPSSLS